MGHGGWRRASVTDTDAVKKKKNVGFALAVERFAIRPTEWSIEALTPC